MLKIYKFLLNDNVKYSINPPYCIVIVAESKEHVEDRFRDITANHVVDMLDYKMTEHELANWQYFIINRK